MIDKILKYFGYVKAGSIEPVVKPRVPHWTDPHPPNSTGPDPRPCCEPVREVYTGEKSTVFPQYQSLDEAFDEFMELYDSTQEAKESAMEFLDKDADIIELWDILLAIELLKRKRK